MSAYLGIPRSDSVNIENALAPAGRVGGWSTCISAPRRESALVVLRHRNMKIRSCATRTLNLVPGTSSPLAWSSKRCIALGNNWINASYSQYANSSCIRQLRTLRQNSEHLIVDQRVMLLKGKTNQRHEQTGILKAPFTAPRGLCPILLA